MAWVLSLISIVLALTGVKNYLTGTFMGDVTVERIRGYEAALTSNPNDLALMLNIILPLSIALLLLERRTGRRLVLLAAIALSVGGVVLTFSRGGFVTLAAMSLMYLWKFRRRAERRLVYAAFLVALACVPLLPGVYVERITTITDISTDPTGSAEARWRDLRAAVGYVLRHPVVGAGIGSDQLALNEERGSYWSSVHNAYLQYAVDLGLPGLVLFMLIMLGCLRRLRDAERLAVRERGQAALLHCVQGMQVSLGAFAVAAIFHPVAYNFYFYYLAGLSLGLSTAAGPSITSSP
jgi:O-antigen ligase